MVRDLLYGQTVDKVRHRLDIPMLIARPDRSPAPLEPGTPILPPARNESPLIPRPSSSERDHAPARGAD
jgi:manganese transport protein